MSKIYEVWMQDEYNNNYLIGFYHELANAVPAINDFLIPYEAKIDTLSVYPSTFGECFDTEVVRTVENEDDDEWTGIMIRGFIFDSEALGDIICDDEAASEN